MQLPPVHLPRVNLQWRAIANRPIQQVMSCVRSLSPAMSAPSVQVITPVQFTLTGGPLLCVSCLHLVLVLERFVD
jgi:hypothetical protein